MTFPTHLLPLPLVPTQKPQKSLSLQAGPSTHQHACFGQRFRLHPEKQRVVRVSDFCAGLAPSSSLAPPLNHVPMMYIQKLSLTQSECSPKAVDFVFLENGPWQHR